MPTGQIRARGRSVCVIGVMLLVAACGSAVPESQARSSSTARPASVATRSVTAGAISSAAMPDEATPTPVGDEVVHGWPSTVRNPAGACSFWDSRFSWVYAMALYG